MVRFVTQAGPGTKTSSSRNQQSTVLAQPYFLNDLRLWYSYFVLRQKGVRASQAKTLHGLQSLARDCDSPLPTAYLPPYDWKPRWLLWLEDTSSDESRRAAAALR